MIDLIETNRLKRVIRTSDQRHCQTNYGRRLLSAACLFQAATYVAGATLFLIVKPNKGWAIGAGSASERMS